MATNDSLTPLQRRRLDMSAAGLSCREIASREGCSATSAATSIRRAREILGTDPEPADAPPSAKPSRLQYQRRQLQLLAYQFDKLKYDSKSHKSLLERAQLLKILVDMGTKLYPEEVKLTPADDGAAHTGAATLITALEAGSQRKAV